MSVPHFVASPNPAERPRSASIRRVLGFVFDVELHALPQELELPFPETALAELLQMVSDLAGARRLRFSTRLPVDSEPWELCLDRAEDALLFTLFRGGPMAEVFVHERATPLEQASTRLMKCVESALATTDAGNDSDAPPRSEVRLQLQSVGASLRRAIPPSPIAAQELAALSIEPTTDMPLMIAADALVRVAQNAIAGPGASSVFRSDLASLLFKGRVRFGVGDQTREMNGVYVFLVAENLVSMTLEAVDAWILGRAYNRRLSYGGLMLGIRIHKVASEPDRPEPDRVHRSLGPCSLTLGTVRKSSSQAWTFPSVDIGALAHGVIAFGRALFRSLVRRDRSQASNLRLLALRSQVRELAERLRETTRNESKINSEPESYRAFAAATRVSIGQREPLGHARLAFALKWTADVPSIDLSSTFLCGDVLVAGSTREIACLERNTGAIIWKRRVPRARSVMTPAGLVRVAFDGNASLHDLNTGETLWTVRLQPCTGGTLSGVVVSGTGLPKMLIVAEATHALTAIDLATGEVRWRHHDRRGNTFRIRRAGKLALVASGDASLTALDVLTGETVWRVYDPLRFASHVTISNDSLFAFAGDGTFVGRGGTRLYHIDVWSGKVAWAMDLPDATPVGSPIVTERTVVVANYDRRGTWLLGLDPATMQVRFRASACSTVASCSGVDDLVIVNSEGGELIGMDTTTGAVRYRHTFDDGGDGDRPRRLEPVLRSGALFVPQTQVVVLRPKDGAILGRVPTDLIADMLRVDERCDIYVAEESGHLAAFSAAPRLTVVR